jgi:predicted nucleic acid-binding protein
MLIDSNMLIYATQPEHDALRRWIVQTLPKVSVISKVEVLGYHRLRPEEQAALENLFDTLEILYPSPATFEIAIWLRRHRKLSLGDALIAATCVEHGLTLATRNTTDFDWLSEIKLINPLANTG